VLPHTGPRRLSVLTADSGFHDHALRPLAHSLGIVDNIHDISHAEGRESTDRERERAAEQVFRLRSKPGWYADGFRELHCIHGHDVHRFRRLSLHGDRAVVRTEARCDHCNSTVTVTAGAWKKVRDTSRRAGDKRGQSMFAPVEPGDPDSVREWDFGNPLTYNDPLAGKYGQMRFGHGEGLHGSAAKRFKLLKTTGYYRTAASCRSTPNTRSSSSAGCAPDWRRRSAAASRNTSSPHIGSSTRASGSSPTAHAAR
jgi:hypothetical protein